MSDCISETHRKPRKKRDEPVEPLAVTQRRSRQLLGGIGETKHRQLIRAGILDVIDLAGMQLVTMESIRRVTRT